MLDQQPKEQMPWLWALSDVSLILLKKSDLFKTVIPSKIFESMAMEKPIILGVEGESADIVRAADSGYCIEPENAEELADRGPGRADDHCLFHGCLRRGKPPYCQPPG